MIAETLGGHLGTLVTIDLCRACQVFWFDSGESLKLSDAGVLKLFGIIGERSIAPPDPGSDTRRIACPRCEGLTPMSTAE